MSQVGLQPACTESKGLLKRKLATVNLSSSLDEHATAICISQRMVLFIRETRDSRSLNWSGLAKGGRIISPRVFGEWGSEADACHYSKTE